jgi:hypothetical protein
MATAEDNRIACPVPSVYDGRISRASASVCERLRRPEPPPEHVPLAFWSSSPRDSGEPADEPPPVVSPFGFGRALARVPDTT